jgi:hypothetical protein
MFAEINSHLLSNPFTIDFDETKALSIAFNEKKADVYSKMGFSPDWEDEYLYITASLLGADFKEHPEIGVFWSDEALEKTVSFVKTWINDANTSTQAVDEFTFKYFFEPPAKLITEGRIFFSYSRSSDYFTLQPERRNALDFRWISSGNIIPVLSDAVYYGLYKGGKAKTAATEFTRWLFSEDTQALLLEQARAVRLSETLFGIAGGFSAMKNVTEHVFPLFYPNLLGHMPPEDYLSPPGILPQNWDTVKRGTLYPQLKSGIRG